MNHPNLRTLTTALVALILPITLLAGVATAAYFKSTNPNDIDITQGLAYLGQTVTVAVAAFVIMTALFILSIIKMYKRDHGFSNAKLPLTLFITICALMVSVLFVNAYTNKVQDKYLTDHGRPTLQQYFDALDKNKSN